MMKAVAIVFTILAIPCFVETAEAGQTSVVAGTHAAATSLPNSQASNPCSRNIRGDSDCESTSHDNVPAAHGSAPVGAGGPGTAAKNGKPIEDSAKSRGLLGSTGAEPPPPAKVVWRAKIVRDAFPAVLIRPDVAFSLTTAFILGLLIASLLWVFTGRKTNATMPVQNSEIIVASEPPSGVAQESATWTSASNFTPRVATSNAEPQPTVIEAVAPALLPDHAESDGFDFRRQAGYPPVVTPRRDAAEPPPASIFEPEVGKVDVEPAPKPFDGDQAADIARGILQRLELDANRMRELLESIRSRSNGPQMAKSYFSALSSLYDDRNVAGRWMVVEPDLKEFLARCFDGGEAAIIAPRRGSTFEPREMNDCSTSVTGSRATVGKLLAPGFKTRDIVVKAMIETN